MDESSTKLVISLGPMTRRQLHQLVWDVPRSRLAEAIGISDVAIGKICRKYWIPVPKRGWWAKLAAGARLKREKLRSEDDSDEIVLVVKQRNNSEPTFDTRPDVRAALELVDLHSNAPTFFDQAAEHQLVADARHQFARIERNLPRRTDWRREVELRSCPLWIETSQSTRERALIALNRVLLAFVACGITPEFREGDREAQFCLNLFGCDYRLRIREHYREPELGSVDAHASTTTCVRSGRIYQCTGRLDLELHERTSWLRAKKRWRDGRKRRIEDLAWVVVRDTILQAHEDRERREMWERQRNAEEAARNARALEEARHAFERRRVELLLNQVEAWARASRLREFAAECRAVAMNEGRSDMATIAWLRWVEETAMRLNPLLHGIDAVRAATEQRSP